MSQSPTQHSDANWSGEAAPDGMPSFAPPGSAASYDSSPPDASSSPDASLGSYTGPGSYSGPGSYTGPGSYSGPGTGSDGPGANPAPTSGPALGGTAARPPEFPAYQPAPYEPAGYRPATFQPADAGYAPPGYPEPGYPEPSYATAPYQPGFPAATLPPSGQLGKVGMGIAVGAAVLLVVTLVFIGALGDPSTAIGGLMLLAMAAGTVGLVISIVATATGRGRKAGIVGIVAGVAAWPAAFVVGVIVSMITGGSL